MRTSKKRRRIEKKRPLALFNGPPTKEEIEKIREEHHAIILAGRSMLPRAFRIGDFFIGCRIRVSVGDWADWLKSNFSNISYRNIRLYVRLARHRQFLETKFGLADTKNANTCIDFERLISIKEAEAAIRDLRRDEKLAKTIGGQRKAIDVEATLSESTSTNDDAQRAIRIGADVETLIAQQDKETPDKIEDPAAPTNPEEEIQDALSKAGSCVRAASTFWLQAVAIAEANGISVDKLQNDFASELGDGYTELALCFTVTTTNWN